MVNALLVYRKYLVKVNFQGKIAGNQPYNGAYSYFLKLDYLLKLLEK